MNHFILLETPFLSGIVDGNAVETSISYGDFRKTVVGLCHSDFPKRDVHSALLLAETELAEIVNHSDSICPKALSLARRALRLVQKLATQLIAWLRHGYDSSTATEPPAIPERVEPTEETETPVAETQTENTETTAIATVSTYTWSRDFVELVEIVDSLFEFDCINNGEVNKSAFLRDIYKLFSINKQPSHFYAARNKLSQKAPADGEGRCRLLPLLHENLEETWEKRYFANFAN